MSPMSYQLLYPALKPPRLFCHGGTSLSYKITLTQRKRKRVQDTYTGTTCASFFKKNSRQIAGCKPNHMKKPSVCFFGVGVCLGWVFVWGGCLFGVGVCLGLAAARAGLAAIVVSTYPTIVPAGLYFCLAGLVAAAAAVCCGDAGRS